MSPDFNAETHTYAEPGTGRRIESVTQVLERAGISDWSNVPDEVLWEAQQRGTMVHRAIHFANQRNLDPESVDERISGYLEAWKAFASDHQLIVRRSEMLLYRRITITDQEVIVPAESDLEIVGTGDAEGNIIRQGEIVLDVKTGDPTDAWAPQLAAYVRALSPTARHTHKRVNVQLSRDGKYRLWWWPIRTFDEHWGVFRNALIEGKRKQVAA
jgi:hypothetical protein